MHLRSRFSSHLNGMALDAKYQRVQTYSLIVAVRLMQNMSCLISHYWKGFSAPNHQTFCVRVKQKPKRVK